jgi:uncharacterized protein YegP (UPF0339 family)
MATATKKVRTTGSAPLEFLVYPDNSGDYHWEIVGERGESLAGCGSFASRDDAEAAARRVHDGAGSARFEPRVAGERKIGAV